LYRILVAEITIPLSLKPSLMKLQESMTGFYYIGTNRANISKLVKIYKRGYASGDFLQAASELTRENHISPEVICCESGLGFTEIKKMTAQLSSNQNLSQVPFIIVDDLHDAEYNYHFIRNKMVDDIISIKDWDENMLAAKFRFLQKFKKRSAQLAVSKKDISFEESRITLQAVLKRSFDILVSLAALVCLLPVFLIIAIAIRLDSKGSIFYISKRAGRGYRIFDFYKFRTMIEDAEYNRLDLAHLNLYKGPNKALFFKLSNDPRISRVGRFLRNTSMDELPQLINVLLGDMSLVGNRPLPLYEAEGLTTDKLAKRFLAPAGMTGLWQIKKRGQAIMSDDERIELDINYADKSNFMYDLWIMANTPQALFQKANS
jgi:lipopolysaccharide/colanic/teichoic acid biosynthesis glycosyltransferase